MKSFETPNGKRIDLYRDKKTSQIRIQFNPGGELPAELEGIFTSEIEAENTINMYLAKKSKK
jgi:hypothetical protein